MLWSKIKRKLILRFFLFELNRTKKTDSSSTDEIVQLSSPEDKFKALVENTNDVLWEANIELKCTYVTPNVYEHMGYTQEEMIGKTPYDFMTKEEAARVFEIVLASIESGQGVKNVQCFLTHKDGRQLATETSTTLILDSKGNLQGFRGIDRNITERKREKDLSDALNDINAAINSTLDSSEIMQRVLNESAKVMECDSSIIVMRSENDWTIQHVTGLPKDIIGMKVGSKAKSFIFDSMKNDPVIVPDVKSDERILSKEDFEGIGSLIIMPLIIKEVIIGGIAFNFSKKHVEFNEAQIDFVKKLSASTSLSLENSRLYAEQLRISNTLQKSFIVMPDSIDSIDFGHLYHSSTMMVSVGGDFYDLFELGNNKLGIIIGDVSGKGLLAANLTAIAKNTIKAYAFYINSPASVLEKANNVVRNSTDLPEMFATVFFGILDKATGNLVYCNGGHPPGFIKRKDNPEILSISTNCPPLGIFEMGEIAHFDFAYVDGTTTLEKGDILILYTDGVIEARRGDEFFELDGLTEHIGNINGVKTSEIPYRIYDKLLSFSGGKLADDIAILAISRS